MDNYVPCVTGAARLSAVKVAYRDLDTGPFQAFRGKVRHANAAMAPPHAPEAHAHRQPGTMAECLRQQLAQRHGLRFPEQPREPSVPGHGELQGIVQTTTREGLLHAYLCWALAGGCGRGSVWCRHPQLSTNRMVHAVGAGWQCLCVLLVEGTESACGQLMTAPQYVCSVGPGLPCSGGPAQSPRPTKNPRRRPGS